MFNTTKSLRGVSAIALANVVCLGAMQASIVQAESADTDSQPRSNLLETVIVTARKQEESLQRVPVSVVAIGGDELAKKSLDNLADIGQSVPNFSFVGTGTGGRDAGIIYIRGVGQGSAGINFDPAVGVYVDGVFLSRPQANDVDMLDVERVEILRGPQGTLFGRNTSGGAVNITTRQPDLSGLFGQLLATGGSRDRVDVAGSVNIPLASDKAALLITGARLKQDGYGEREDGQTLGDTDRYMGRAKLLLKPMDELSLTLEADGLRYDETNAVTRLVAINPAAQAPFVINAFTPLPFDDRWIPSDDFFSYGTGPNSSRGKVWGTSLTANYDAEPVTLKSITAYRGFSIHSDYDVDTSPIQIFDFMGAARQHQFSQELQASGNSFGDRLNWVGGLYYLHEVASAPTYYLILQALDPSCGFCSGSIVHQTTSSYAAYGQGSYGITEALKATLGLRFTHDRKEFHGSNVTYPALAVTAPIPKQRQNWDDVSPRLGLDYQWTPDVMTYVSAAKGYKGGGFNGGIPSTISNQQYDPEVVWTYEVGLRADLLAQRLRFNVTAFYNDYSDLQMQIGGAVTDADGNPAPFSITDNIPKVKVTGAEVELTAVPFEGLTLTSSLGITDAKYKRLPTNSLWESAGSVGGTVSTSTNFPFTPQVSYAVGAEYATHVAVKFSTAFTSPPSCSRSPTVCWMRG